MNVKPPRADRREALRKMAGLSGCCLLGAGTFVLSGCESDKVKSSGAGEELDISTVPELAAAGGAVKRVFGENNGGRPVIILRKTAGDFLVLSSVCTHQGCEVNLPASAGATIDCPCHGSRFSSADGKVVQDPAPSPLRQYASTYNAQTRKLTIVF
ncbi:MAG: QcrA and Rieske domain-containing protein [Candidatus Latescibacterota bacterium]